MKSGETGRPGLSHQVGWLLAFVALAGCASRPVAPIAAQLEAIRARVETQFARALYVKPAATGDVPEPVRQLAPLLIIESLSNNGLAAGNTPDVPAQIFFHTGEAMLNGRRHQQVAYWWDYPRRRRGEGRLSTQGVRLTLNAAGLPVIWEVLADISGARLLFVSQNLETQAIREFGGPVSGRRFAVERLPSDAPSAVAARVLEDGPVAMGPIVYLRAGSGEVTTVICRCMDSQARELAGQREYELRTGLVGRSPFQSQAGVDLVLRLPKRL